MKITVGTLRRIIREEFAGYGEAVDDLPDINAMAKMHPDELLKLSKTATNRFYGQTASLLANAFQAKAAGDAKLMAQYIEKAKTAWKRSQEDERGQVRRAQDMRQHVKDQGVKSAAEVGHASYGDYGTPRVAMAGIASANKKVR